MKKYFYMIGAITTALAMSMLPAVAIARDNGNGDEKGGTAEVRVTNIGTSTTVRMRSDEEKQERRTEATSSSEQKNNENVKGEDQNEQDINLELEDDTAPLAISLGDLKQKIEKRKHELEEEVASTTEEDKNIVENVNPVRLAVHSLLASKGLLGGIGEEVSRIAKDMNDSVATTTNAEAEMQSRGFWRHLFFGGDSEAAGVISQEVAKNQENIQKLTDLLNQANISADIQATLKAQITALEEAQTRLQELAKKEQKIWGLFSWRF